MPINIKTQDVVIDGSPVHSPHTTHHSYCRGWQRGDPGLSRPSFSLPLVTQATATGKRVVDSVGGLLWACWDQTAGCGHEYRQPLM